MSKHKESRRENGQFDKGHKPKTMWKKGQSGNPKGLRSPYTDLIKELSLKKVDGKEQRLVVMNKLFELAKRGDMKAIQFIVERLEGKALERQERTNKNEPIQVMVLQE